MAYINPESDLQFFEKYKDIASVDYQTFMYRRRKFKNLTRAECLVVTNPSKNLKDTKTFQKYLRIALENGINRELFYNRIVSGTMSFNDASMKKINEKKKAVETKRDSKKTFKKDTKKEKFKKRIEENQYKINYILEMQKDNPKYWYDFLSGKNKQFYDNNKELFEGMI